MRIRLRTLRSGGNTGPLEIFWSFTTDTLLTAGIYVLLVIITLGLSYVARLTKEDHIHYYVFRSLEIGIFLCGSVIVALILTYVTVLTARDLIRSFRLELRRSDEHPQAAPPAILPGDA